MLICNIYQFIQRVICINVSLSAEHFSATAVYNVIYRFCDAADIFHLNCLFFFCARLMQVIIAITCKNKTITLTFNSLNLHSLSSLADYFTNVISRDLVFGSNSFSFVFRFQSIDII